MEKIVIDKNNTGTFNVTQGEKMADNLGWDEMLGLVASLTMPEHRPCLQWMWTEEQRKAFYERYGTGEDKTAHHLLCSK